MSGISISRFFSRLWRSITEAYSDDLYQDPWKFEFVVLDTETTGFDYYTDRILCVGALKLREDRINVNDCLEIYLDQQHYNRESTEVHGILKNEGRDCVQEREAMLRLSNYIGDAIIVAHHTRFDMTMINKALKRQGLPALKNRTLDTSKMYRKTLITSPLLRKKQSYSLDELADKFNLSKKDRHTALGDAYITALAFIRIVKILRKKYLNLTVMDLM
ncbi:3'-5' exonuclease [Zeaxanthinibacter sp. PT1]|uniref:3'-5' exonuclease n=1 Tax=Zeaxanthinibacter TaxID=561554 RepID=UPI002349A918|nr:3'-5' exonuclease [Zeaxanthinibacter sp. PT1]MDC6351324.1 3'-5' exonuclease [Zeaxanthinibacter sp. PT1]